MRHVWVNGVQVLKDGEHTGAKPGRVVRGPGWRLRKLEVRSEKLEVELRNFHFLTPMLISINARYKAHAGIKIAGLPEAEHWE